MPSRAARVEYARRLGHWRPRHAAARAAVQRLGTARLALFLVGLPAVIWLFRIHPEWGLLAALPVTAFAFLVLRHEAARAKERSAARAVAWYERALRRLDERWTDDGPDGLDLLDALPLHARDLDLFGKGSLFQKLATARTSLGTGALARWLAEPAPPDVIRARQAAARELVPDLDLREDLARLDERVGRAVHPQALGEWAASPPVRVSALERAASAVLGLLAIAAVGAWIGTDLGAGPLVLVVLLEAGMTAIVQRRISAVARGAESAAGSLDAFAGLLSLIESRPWTSPRLAALHAEMQADDGSASRAVERLDRLVERLVSSRRGSVHAVVAFLLQLPLQHAHAVERWRARIGPSLPRWLAAAGEVEALCCLAIHAYENPDHAWPEFVDDSPLLHLVGVGHPLLPADRCVRNDLVLDDAHRLVVVSGSNMSGKSTMLRAVGLAVAAAQAGAPVRAGAIRLSPFALGTSLRIEDDLLAGASHFYAEISRLRAIADLVDGPRPVLFLLDEILHGTNSADRLVGARGVVLRLLERGAVGLVTTHDLALARIVDEIGSAARNAHFEDQVVDGRMSFDYRMRDGVVQRSNALDLMRSLGLPV